ncbi:arginyl-tRNA synthetase [Porphyromonas gingivicanis]|uniref:Arginine--tRNA ligase n=1 Tax=Porphyromonas gingivicanis TaxID=266762 RepID=A0A0A2G5D2_9PORP|nr:arginine--tRNA ligase [Porphyromonas gingivicanis]KGN98483.1 arginyl-tRNA synthetase [Porphyromonas gingivicanis]
MSLQQQLSTAFSTTLEKLYGAQACELLQIQKTRPEFEGHITLVVFPLLKLSRKKPEETAEEIAKALQSSYEWIASYNVVKGFLNLSLTPSLWISALQEIGNTSDYGHKKVTEEAPLVMIEYSSPNTNKPLHLGHIRNNLLGYSLSRILDANGLKVVKTNIVNDRGIHICKSMLAWIKWGNQATPESTGKKGDHLVGDFYVEFDKHYKEELKELMGKGMSKEEAENASPLMKEAREMLRKWENGDEEVLSLWRTMNQWVYDGFDETYRRLGVDFDKIYYESETYLRGKEEVLRGLDEGLFVRHEDGSVWADLTQEGLDEKILLRSDGTSVYMTQDIGTAKLRYKDYPIDRMVYVVGNEQEYHFKVLSLLLDRLGFAFGKSLVHFSYGMVELPNGRMKSREGTVVDADDLMDEMIDAAEQIAKEAGRAADFSDEERREVARRVGLGSLKYFILKVDPRKNMTFNPEESIDFNGNTASFIQYTYARIRSLLEKATQSGDTFSDKFTTVTTLSAREIELIQQLSDYPSVIEEAGRIYSPALIANYVYDLVKAYNSFYHDCPIMKESDVALRGVRLFLSRTVADTICRAMALLGIEMPEKM